MNRLALSEAKRFGAQTTVFSCRPFLTENRSEDRLIYSDLKGYNKTTLGDEFIVLDKLSKDHLKKYNYQGRIQLYEFEQANNKDNLLHLKNGLLLLFAGTYLNKSLIELLRDLKTEELRYPVLYYREHPSKKIAQEQYDQLKSVTDKVVCLTGKLWSELYFENVIAVTCNTTAAIDAVSRGCTLLWLPYISEQSLQFSELMDIVGERSDTFEESIKFLKKYNQDTAFRLTVEERIKVQYQQYIKI